MHAPIVCAMATFPPRREGAIRVINDLVLQCDAMKVYMNGYSEVPADFPVSDKIEYLLAGPGCEHPDIGSQGKLFWLGKSECYYITVDDDIFYPPDYVATLVAGVDKYGRKAIVGFHGGVYRIRAGGPMPPNGFAKDQRVLYPYDKSCSRDMGVHVLGVGVMACYPTALGMTTDTVRQGPLHSGDDEDIAIWAQKNQVPLVKLQTRANWVTPNPRQWIIDPLHRRMDYMRASDAKLKTWKTWFIYQPPPVNIVAPSRYIHNPNEVRFESKPIAAEDVVFCNKMLSSDALAVIIISRIQNRTPTSVIRTSDGERAIIAYSKGGPLTDFTRNPAWLKRYGLTGADLKQVGCDLLWAGKNADFLACTVSGVHLKDFRVHPYFERQQYIDQFYPQLWSATDRVGSVLRAGPVLVLHREHERIVPVLKDRYGCEVTGMMLDSWRDHENLLATLPKSAARTILVSGGASCKAFCVRLAAASGKVVLDVGEALTGSWVK